MIENDKYYLVTADNWFVTPSGFQAKAAWGKCRIIKVDEAFNFTPQRPSTNWFCKIGEGDKSIILAGCQIHYAVQCKERPIELPGTYTESDSTWPVNKIYFTE